jgi:hypothetical protein
LQLNKGKKEEKKERKKYADIPLMMVNLIIIRIIQSNKLTFIPTLLSLSLYIYNILTHSLISLYDPSRHSMYVCTYYEPIIGGADRVL